MSSLEFFFLHMINVLNYAWVGTDPKDGYDHAGSALDFDI